MIFLRELRRAYSKHLISTVISTLQIKIRSSALGNSFNTSISLISNHVICTCTGINCNIVLAGENKDVVSELMIVR